MPNAHHKNARHGVYLVIRSLTFAGLRDGDPNLPEGQIVEKKAPVMQGLARPNIVVSHSPGIETEEDGTTAADDWGYPVVVTINLPENQTLNVEQGEELYWREQIRRAFHRKRPALLVAQMTVPIKECRFEPGFIFTPEYFLSSNTNNSVMTIRVVTRELRG